MSKKISLALGSGGARGLAHIGAIEVLEREGYQITSVSGTSIGSVIGGLYAADKLELFRDWICNLDKKGVLGLMDWTLNAQGFIKGDKVFNQIKKMIGEPLIEDLRIPFTAVAADINSKKEIHFSKGSLFTAMRASVAIPSVLTPVTLNNMVLVDGGVMNPVPTDIYFNVPGEELFAIDLNARIPYNKPEGLNKAKAEKDSKAQRFWNASFEQSIQKWLMNSPSEEEKPNYFKIINQSFDLMQDKLAEVSLQKYPPHVLIPISRYAADTFEFFRAEELIIAGAKAAEEALAKRKSNLEPQ